MGNPDLNQIFREYLKNQNQTGTAKAEEDTEKSFKEQQQKLKLSGESPLGAFGAIGKSQYDEGLNPLNIETVDEKRAQAQTWYDKLGNDVLKFGGTTIQSFGGIASVPVGIFDAAISKDISKIFNNPVSQALNEMNKSLEENFPNYYTKKEQEAPLYSPDYWFTTNFLLDKIGKNLGYTVGAIGSSVVVAKAFQSLGKVAAAKATSKVIEEAQALVKAGKYRSIEDASVEALEKISSSIRRLDAVGKSIAIGTAATGEATVEALNILDETEAAYTKKLKADKFRKIYGNEIPVTDANLDLIHLNDDEKSLVDTAKKSAANVGFALNSALLGFSDIIQWGKLLDSFKVSKQIEQNLGKGLVYKTAAERTAAEAGKTIAGETPKVFTEGAFEGTRLFSQTKTGKVLNILKQPFNEMTEEQLQFATQKGTEDYYTKQKEDNSNSTLKNIFTSVGEGFTQAYGTKEGWENGLLGFITGGLTGIIEGRSQLNETIKENKLQDTRMQIAAEILNKYTKSNNFQNVLRNVKNNIETTKQMEEAVRSNDIHKLKNLEWDNFKEYVLSRIKTGKFDLLKEELQDQLREVKDNPNTSKYINKLLKSAEEIRNIHDNIETIYGGANNSAESNIYHNLIKEALFDSATNLSNRKSRLNSLTSELSRITNGAVQYILPNADETPEQRKERMKTINESLIKWRKNEDNQNEPTEHLKRIKELKDSQIFKDLETLHRESKINSDNFHYWNSEKGKADLKEEANKRQQLEDSKSLDALKNLVDKANTKDKLKNLLSEVQKDDYQVLGKNLTQGVRNQTIAAIKNKLKAKDTQEENAVHSNNVVAETINRPPANESEETNQEISEEEKKLKEQEELEYNARLTEKLQGVTPNHSVKVVQNLINIIKEPTKYSEENVKLAKSKLKEWQDANNTIYYDLDSAPEPGTNLALFDSIVNSVGNRKNEEDFRKLRLTTGEITLTQMLFNTIEKELKVTSKLTFSDIAKYVFVNYGKQSLEDSFNILKFVYAGHYALGYYTSPDIEILPKIDVNYIVKQVNKERIPLENLDEVLPNNSTNIFIDSLFNLEEINGLIEITNEEEAERINFILNKLKEGDKVRILIDTNHEDYEANKSNPDTVPLKIETPDGSHVGFHNVLPHTHGGIIYTGEGNDITDLLQQEDVLRELEKHWIDLMNWNKNVPNNGDIKAFHAFLYKLINVNREEDNKIDIDKNPEQADKAVKHLLNIITYGTNTDVASFNPQELNNRINTWDEKIKRDIYGTLLIRDEIRIDPSKIIETTVTYKSTGSAIKSRDAKGNIVFHTLDSVLDEINLLHSTVENSFNLVSIDGKNLTHSNSSANYSGLYTIIKSARINSNGERQNIAVRLVNNTINNLAISKDVTLSKEQKEYRTGLINHITKLLEQGLKILNEQGNTQDLEEELRKFIIVDKNNLRLNKAFKEIQLRFYDTDNQSNLASIVQLKKSSNLIINGVKIANSVTEKDLYNRELAKVIAGLKRNVALTKNQNELKYTEFIDYDGKVYNYKDYLIKTGAIVTDLGAIKDSNGKIISNVTGRGASPLIINVGNSNINNSTQTQEKNITVSTFDALKTAYNLLPEYDFLYEIADKLGIKLEKEIRDASLGQFGEYIKSSNSIYFTNKWENSPVFNKSLFVAHEIIHGIINNEINKEKYSKFKEELTAFFDSIKDVKTTDPTTLQILEYIKNSTVEEVATYGLTNVQFANFLKSIPSTKQITKGKENSLWEELKDIISNFITEVANTLGVTKLDELVSILDKYIEYKNIDTENIKSDTPIDRVKINRPNSNNDIKLATIDSKNKLKEILVRGNIKSNGFFEKSIDPLMLQIALNKAGFNQYRVTPTRTNGGYYIKYAGKKYTPRFATIDSDISRKIQDKLEKLYPEIKLNITNNPVWETGDNVFNQAEFNNQIKYRLKAIKILSSDKAKKIFAKGEKANWDLKTILDKLEEPENDTSTLNTELRAKINKIQKELQDLFKNKEGNTSRALTLKEQVGSLKQKLKENEDRPIDQTEGIPKEQKQLILDKELGNNKADVILPIGTSGSGKSTFVKSLPQENLVVISPDEMRVEFTGDINNKSKDKEIYEEAAKRAIQAVKNGKQVVFDTTNLTKDKRLPFIEAIKKELPNANIKYKLMPLNAELAKQRIKAQLARDENRAAVSDSTIDRHAESYKQMLEDIKSEPISNFNNQQEQVKREEIITSLLANYSYTVEINTATEKGKDYKMVDYGDGDFRPEPIEPDYTEEFDTEEITDEEGNYIGERIVEESRRIIIHNQKELDAIDDTKPTQHYSNLTVPGGTNYTENAHVIPALKGKVLPDIYPHHDKEFAKGDLNMYGWDRSDDKLINVNKVDNEELKALQEEARQIGDRSILEQTIGGTPTKTRRILEIHSKFQKWRLNFEHKSNKYQLLENQPTDKLNVFEDHYLENGKRITAKEYNKIFEEFLDTPTSKEDAFIKLIAKQWETMMIKSIIQDSAKKGYEKVLFPTGNTASKVEGHTTLEEFKKQKEDRIKELEDKIENYNKDLIDYEEQIKNIEKEYEANKDDEAFMLNYENIGASLDHTKFEINNFNNEINQLKQELERVETEGFSALKPIYNFYENTVTNILNKTYGKVQDFSNTPVKQGVDDLFKEYTELSKIGSKQLYSDYLDTIFPDSKVEEMDNSLYNSVLNNLEQQNEIEKDCTGGGKLKAKKGLATSFTKGGRWKVIKDLKGYPTHKEGGVDLTISKDGVSIKNGNTQFIAKHGLVIPKN
jgi:predicted kinase